jgi:hypothetical protein
MTVEDNVKRLGVGCGDGKNGSTPAGMLIVRETLGSDVSPRTGPEPTVPLEPLGSRRSGCCLIHGKRFRGWDAETSRVLRRAFA